MKTLVVINALFNDERSHAPLAGAKSAFDLVCDFASGLAGFDSALVLASGSGTVPGIPSAKAFDASSLGGKPAFSLASRDDWTPALLLAESFARAKERDCDTVAFVHGDAPFLSKALGDEVMALYSRYRVDYAYADGYPLGLAPELMATRALEIVARLAEGLPRSIERDIVFQALAKDINSFDIETAISPVDLREFRLSFFCSGKRGRATCEAALSSGIFGPGARDGLFDHASACAAIPARLSIKRTLPAFYNVQITSNCPQRCPYCPYPGAAEGMARGAMDPGAYAKLMDEIVALSGDAVVDISLWGDPLLHPEFERIVRETLARRELSLIVETSGLGADPDLVARLAKEFPARLYWVV